MDNGHPYNSEKGVINHDDDGDNKWSKRIESHGDDAMQ